MKIALVSTPFFGVPPKQYGGLEIVVSDLFNALLELGHKVVLFAPEGSEVPKNGFVFQTGKPLESVQVDWVKAEEDMFNVCKDKLASFDIVSAHNWFGFEYAAKLKNNKINILHTHHGHLNPEWWLKSKPPFKLNFIAISKHMQEEYKKQGMPSEYVYNGINTKKYEYQENKGDRLLYVGRIDQFKQPHVAIEIAKKLGIGLDLVGGTFVQDKKYVEQIKAACDGKQITFNPDVSQDVKLQFMKNARCLLFPSQMKEPFGLVAAESMCCGTPVIALNDGAISEVVEDGVTGYVCNSVSEMLLSVTKLDKIYSKKCRERVEANFSREVMASNYVKLYGKVLAGKDW